MHDLPPDDRPERTSEEGSEEEKERAKKRFKQAAKDARETIDALEDKRSPSGMKDTGVSCPHRCGGTIQEETTYEYLDDPMRLIGPGSWRREVLCIEMYYCNVCATLFNHIPMQEVGMHEVPEHPGVAGKKIAPPREVKHYPTGNTCTQMGCRGNVIREIVWVDGEQQTPQLFCSDCSVLFHSLPGK